MPIYLLKNTQYIVASIVSQYIALLPLYRDTYRIVRFLSIHPLSFILNVCISENLQNIFIIYFIYFIVQLLPKKKKEKYTERKLLLQCFWNGESCSESRSWAKFRELEGLNIYHNFSPVLQEDTHTLANYDLFKCIRTHLTHCRHIWWHFFFP